VSALCSNNLTECACTSGDSTAQDECRYFIGMKDALSYICSSNDRRRVYRENIQCILLNNEQEVDRCWDANNKTCAGYNGAFKCYYASIKTKCNEITARLMTQFQLKRFQPLLASIPCTIDTSSYLAQSDDFSTSFAVITRPSSTYILLLAILSALVVAPLQPLHG
jgi:hypothetical protein